MNRTAFGRPRQSLILPLLGALLAIGTGCVDAYPAGPEASEAALSQGADVADPLVVMTRNLFLGADLSVALEVQNPAQIPLMVSQLWQTVLANDFPARAQAIADEIAATRPHLIGLQEVSIYRVQAPGDAHLGNPTAATEVVLDYLTILQAALAARGQFYDVVATNATIDLELPFVAGVDATGPILNDLRMTDRDVILARSDVSTWDPTGGVFEAALEVQVAGAFPLRLDRGWVSVNARAAGRSFHFVNTHLEAWVEPIQIAQGMELVSTLAGISAPIVMVGDFNTGPGGRLATYGSIRSAGFVDTWTQAGGGAAATCCFADLTDPGETLYERVDLVWVRDGRGLPSGRIAGAVDSEIVGNEPGDMIGGLWPSDHAGVVASLRAPPGVWAGNARP